MFERKHRKEPEKLGGITFYISMLALAIIAASNLLHLPDLWDELARARAYRFAFGVVTGMSIAALLVRDHMAVLLHELKHASISTLVGNRFKGIRISRHTGHYQYSYTEKTAHHNATIALAPYWFPLATLPLFLLTIGDFMAFESLLLVIGIGYGIDLLSGIRDVGPHQSDLTSIRGSYVVSLAYLALMHTILFTILTAWAYQGLFGLKYLLYGLWNVAIGFAAYYYD